MREAEGGEEVQGEEGEAAWEGRQGEEGSEGSTIEDKLLGFPTPPAPYYCRIKDDASNI